MKNEAWQPPGTGPYTGRQDFLSEGSMDKAEILKRNLAAIEAAKVRDPFAKVREGNMRDLVARLRLYARSDGGPYPHMDAEQAADTIERLQAQVAELQEAIRSLRDMASHNNDGVSFDIADKALGAP